MTTSLLAPRLSRKARWRPPPARLAMVLPLADVAGLTAACLLVVALGSAAAEWGSAAWGATAYGCAVLVLLVADGQHRLRICRRVSDQLPRTVAVVAMPLLVVLPWVGPDAWVGPDTGMALGLCCTAALVTARVGTCTALRAAHRRGRWREATLIVGTGATAVRVVELLRDHPELGLAPRGFLDGRTSQLLGLPRLGEPAELASVVTEYGIQRVIVCFPATRDVDLVPLVRACRGLPVDICLVPRCYELGAALPRGYLDELGDIPLIPLRRLGHSRLGTTTKAALDLVGAAALFIVLVPVLLALALAVRLDGGGRVLFRQTRLTRYGRPMELLKLRSMIAHADSDTRWAVLPEHTTRLGRRQLGHWLRTTHLDELPQLVNVLRGEMSLVGPRPERPYFAERFAAALPRYADRHRMRAGLTGWAQVNGLHGDTSIAERIRFDNFYIEHWSPWMDLVILVRTLCAPSGGRQ